MKLITHGASDGVAIATGLKKAGIFFTESEPEFEKMIARIGTGNDIPFVEKHAQRLVSFGPPSWRNSEEMTRADIHYIQNLFCQLMRVLLYI